MSTPMSTQDREFPLGARIAATAAALVAGGVLVACGATAEGGGGGGGVATSSDRVAVRAVDHPDLGRILVDADGRTLYFADQEADGTLRCLDECLEFWFPAESPAEEPVAPGVDALGVLQRSDNGANQLTYDGKPLYTFQLDKAAGDANGHDVEDDFAGTHFVWHAVTVDGEAPPQQDDGGGYGGGGY
jgi:predicted lipoprotein with Yx(FWY)xxD motif